MNLANKLANKAPERQHHWQAFEAVARKERAYCSVCFQKTAAFAFILFFGGGSPTGDLFSGGSRIGGLFSDGGSTGGFFGSFGGSLLGDLATFFMESILLRSSLVSRHTTSNGESWKAPASEPKGCVQAWTAEVTPIKVYLLFYSLAQQLTPKKSSIRAYRNVCKVSLRSPCSNDRRRILARS